jgi:hypothetical protein
MPLSTRDSAISEHTTEHSYPYRLHEPAEPSDQDKLSTATTTATYRLTSGRKHRDASETNHAAEDVGVADVALPVLDQTTAGPSKHALPVTAARAALLVTNSATNRIELSPPSRKSNRNSPRHLPPGTGRSVGAIGNRLGISRLRAADAGRFGHDGKPAAAPASTGTLQGYVVQSIGNEDCQTSA